MNPITQMLLAIFGRLPVFANVGYGVHEGNLTKTLESDISTRHLLGKPGSSSAEIDLCGVGNRPLGVITDTGNEGDAVNVALLGSSTTTVLMVASGPITAGSPVYTAGGGKVQSQPSSPVTVYQVGIAVSAASGNGECFEVLPIDPRKTAIIAAFTGTASTDIAVLGSTFEAGPDKIIMLG
ncbi:MAG: DUF2190 family protein [Puniceicoccales bacterium]